MRRELLFWERPSPASISLNFGLLSTHKFSSAISAILVNLWAPDLISPKYWIDWNMTQLFMWASGKDSSRSFRNYCGGVLWWWCGRNWGQLAYWNTCCWMWYCPVIESLAERGEGRVQQLRRLVADDLENTLKTGLLYMVQWPIGVVFVVESGRRFLFLSNSVNIFTQIITLPPENVNWNRNSIELNWIEEKNTNLERCGVRMI